MDAIVEKLRCVEARAKNPYADATVKNPSENPNPVGAMVNNNLCV